MRLSSTQGSQKTTDSGETPSSQAEAWLRDNHLSHVNSIADTERYKEWEIQSKTFTDTVELVQKSSKQPETKHKSLLLTSKNSLCLQFEALKASHKHLRASGIMSRIPSDALKFSMDVDYSTMMLNSIIELVNIPDPSSRNLYYKVPRFRNDKKLYDTAASQAKEFLLDLSYAHSALAAELHKHHRYIDSSPGAVTNSGSSSSRAPLSSTTHLQEPGTSLIDSNQTKGEDVDAITALPSDQVSYLD